MLTPTGPLGSDWIILSDHALPTEAATAWASVPRAGAVVVFLGIVRDHADGRTDVTALTYEAYETEARRVMSDIVATVRVDQPALERVAVMHRTGRLEVGESSVAVVVSSAHRDAAFAGARSCIDTLKETVPIWKQEHWAAGDDWGTGATPIRPVRPEAAR